MGWVMSQRITLPRVTWSVLSGCEKTHLVMCVFFFPLCVICMYVLHIIGIYALPYLLGGDLHSNQVKLLYVSVEYVWLSHKCCSGSVLFFSSFFCIFFSFASICSFVGFCSGKEYGNLRKKYESRPGFSERGCGNTMSWLVMPLCRTSVIHSLTQLLTHRLTVSRCLA
ncbi:hypothetical protein F4859DRAFT_408332 [Xylaria cf. heliscus]|nr:hypothetical protein F4859DRAFT_408332 [Xylaria cf. heliscus]